MPVAQSCHTVSVVHLVDVFLNINVCFLKSYYSSKVETLDMAVQEHVLL